MNPSRTPHLLPVCVVALIALTFIGCGSGSGAEPGGGSNVPGPSAPLALGIQGVDGDSDAAGLAASFASGVPQGARLTFVGDRVTLMGEGFSPQMRIFLGMNNAIARRENSLLSSEVEDLPSGPFVYVDPDATTSRTILEVEATFEFVTRRRHQEHQHGCRVCGLNLMGPVVFDVEDDMRAGFEDLHHGGPWCSIPIAAVLSPLEHAAAFDQVAELLVADEPVVDAVGLPRPRRTGRRRHGEAGV